MNPNDILTLLLGGGLPMNPMAQAVSSQPITPSPVMFGGPGGGSPAYEAAALAQRMRAAEEARANEEMVKMQTLMTMLSPSMSAEVASQTGGPGALENAFGLNPDQSGQLIQQMLGLKLSPVQLQTGQTELMKLIPELQKAQASMTTADAAQRQAGVAEKEAGVKEREVKVKEDTEARLKAQWEQGTPQDRAALYEMNLKNIALTGTTIDGKAVPLDVRQNAYALLKGFSTMPGVTQLITELAKDGQWEQAGKLIGLPEGSIKQTFWSWLLPGGNSVNIGEKARGFAQAPYTGLVAPGAAAPMAGQATPGMDPAQLEATIGQMQKNFADNFWKIMEKSGQPSKVQ